MSTPSTRPRSDAFAGSLTQQELRAGWAEGRAMTAAAAVALAISV